MKVKVKAKAEARCRVSVQDLSSTLAVNASLGKSRSAVGANRCHFAKASAESLKLGTARDPPKKQLIATHRCLQRNLCTSFSKQLPNLTSSKGKHHTCKGPYRSVLTVNSRRSLLSSFQVTTNNVVRTSCTEGTQAVT